MHCEVGVSNEIKLTYDESHSHLTEKKSLYLQNSMHVWNESEERYLIDLRLQREGKFSGTKSHDILWGEIATEMKKMVYMLPNYNSSISRRH